MDTLRYPTLKSWATAVCDAVREKEESTGEIPHQDVPDRILGLRSRPGTYQGPYTVEPSGDVQTLATKEKVMAEDLVIKPSSEHGCVTLETTCYEGGAEQLEFYSALSAIDPDAGKAFWDEVIPKMKACYVCWFGAYQPGNVSHEYVSMSMYYIDDGYGELDSRFHVVVLDVENGTLKSVNPNFEVWYDHGTKYVYVKPIKAYEGDPYSFAYRSRYYLSIVY